MIALETNAMMLPIFKNIRWLGGLLVSLPLWFMKLIEPEGAGNAEMLRAARNHIRRLISDPSLLNAAGHKTAFQAMMELFPKGVEVDEEHKLTYLTQEANTIVTAGSETTASVLEVGLFRVLQNKAICDRLFEELKEAIPNLKEAPKLAMLKQLPYLVSIHPPGDMFWKETAFSHGILLEGKRVILRLLIVCMRQRVPTSYLRCPWGPSTCGPCRWC